MQHGFRSMSEPPPPAPAAASSPAPSLSFWKVVLLSLRGHHLDFTTEPMRRSVLLMAVPMILEMVMESLFAVADVFWVSHLGKEAVAVVGLTESVMTIIYAIAIGISISAGAMVARRTGEKDPERAARAAGQALLLGAGISLALGAALAAFAPEILRRLGAEESIVALGSDFARVMLGGNITVFLIFLINAVFRGAGDAVIAMRTLWLANGINILLGPCFIFGWGPFPEMGVTGAAVATTIGRGVGVLYQIRHLAGKSGRLRLRRCHLFPDVSILASLLRLSVTGVAQMLIGTTSWIGLMKIMSVFGSAALAGYTIAMRLILFFLLPAWGLANAGATLVGQNLGAGRPDRSEEAVKIATKYNVIFLSATGLALLVFASPVTRLFTADPAVAAHATRALWIIALGFPFYAAGMCYTSAFNGAGDTKTPTLLNLFCFWLFEIPFAWLLASALKLGPTGVFVAIAAAFSALAVFSVSLFRRGKWKERRV